MKKGKRRRKKKTLSPEELERRAAEAYVARFGLENLITQALCTARRADQLRQDL